MLEQTSQDTGHQWIATLVSAAVGAGGWKMLSVWLENRRLTKREYRETLQSLIEQQSRRISELESCVAGLQVRIGNLRVEVAHLESENTELRRATGLAPRKLQEGPDAPESTAGEGNAS